MKNLYHVYVFVPFIYFIYLFVFISFILFLIEIYKFSRESKKTAHAENGKYLYYISRSPASETNKVIVDIKSGQIPKKNLKKK